MSDEEKQTKKPAVAGIEGMDEAMFEAADRVVESSWLSKQRTSIEKARKRALGMVKDYQEDAWFRAEASVWFSVVINVFYSAYQTIQAIRYNRAWFMALAIYGIMVTVTRGVILRYLRPDAEDGREELERYRNCGQLLIMLALSVALLALVVNYAGEHPVYPGTMIYVVSGYTIFMVFSSISNLIIYRKLESPLISASKQVSMACALVSLYSCQAAVLALYAVGEYSWLRNRLNVGSAVIICLIILLFGAHIINRASRALAGKEDLSFVVAAKAKIVGDDNRVEWQEHAAEAQRQLEYWRGKDKVEWRTQGGAWERYNEETQERFRKRDERKSQRKAQNQSKRKRKSRKKKK